MKTSTICERLETYQPSNPAVDTKIENVHELHQLLGPAWLPMLEDELTRLMLDQMREDGSLRSHLQQHFGKPMGNIVNGVKLRTAQTYTVRKGKEAGKTVTTRGEIVALARWVAQNENATLDQANHFESELRGDQENQEFFKTPMCCGDCSICRHARGIVLGIL